SLLTVAWHWLRKSIVGIRTSLDVLSRPRWISERRTDLLGLGPLRRTRQGRCRRTLFIFAFKEIERVDSLQESALGRFWLACINRWRRILVYRLGYIGGFGRSRSARYILRGSNHWISRKFYCLEVRRGRYRLNGHYFGSIPCFR